MDLLCSTPTKPITGATLTIAGSKSESNRLLILKALYPALAIGNLSTSDDTKYLEQVLASDTTVLDIGHAGTAMRFGTAYFAAQAGREITLTGSDRMKQRPIGVLVDALRDLGAQIEYLEEEGYPPLHIKGKALKGGVVTVDATVSSQFLTALLLIAPSLETPLTLHLTGSLTSRPYLEMTVTLLQSLGVKTTWLQTSQEQHELETIIVEPLLELVNNTAQVESDWSSAGYWYSWVAFQQPGYELILKTFKEDSLQGDSALVTIFKQLGVSSHFNHTSLILKKVDLPLPEQINLDLTNEPDQAQTVFATCLGLGIDAHLTGLHTLKIKETDRIEAMKLVGDRFRESVITTTDSSITIQMNKEKNLRENVRVDTFNDHRMAMAFAPLCVFTSVIIKDAGVVSKSYPSYWKDLVKLNCSVKEI